MLKQSEKLQGFPQISPGGQNMEDRQKEKGEKKEKSDTANLRQGSAQM